MASKKKSAKKAKRATRAPSTDIWVTLNGIGEEYHFWESEPEFDGVFWGGELANTMCRSGVEEALCGLVSLDKVEANDILKLRVTTLVHRRPVSEKTNLVNVK